MAGRRARALVLVIGVVCVVLAGCGGPTDAQLASLAALPQPTPDPTLDAVVRNLPKELAGVSPTPTPAPAPIIKRSVPTAQAKPSVHRSPTPTSVRKPSR